MTDKVISEVLSQHAEEVAFLWLVRNAAVHASHYSVSDLIHLDERIEAHLDGLRVNGAAGWRMCMRSSARGGAEELFAAAVLSFETADEQRIATILQIESAPAELCRGLVSGLGWLPYAQIEKHIGLLLTASSSLLRHVGIAATAIHREDPGQALINALTDDDPFLRARAFRAVGELGRMDLLSHVRNALAFGDEKCKFSAAWSAALLGDLNSVPVLKAIADSNVAYKQEAAALALRRMDLATAEKWQRELAENPGSVRLAVIGTSAIGDPGLIPWLIEQMKVPEVARVAGEAFTMITGVDIAYEDLEGEKPEGFESGPTEDPEDENVEMDPDENLPWPNHKLIQEWWNHHRGSFQNGTRYLIGKPITEEWLQQVLRIGRQRQRAAAALELVLRRPGQPLFEVRAPGFRQQQMLGLKVTR